MKQQKPAGAVSQLDDHDEPLAPIYGTNRPDEMDYREVEGRQNIFGGNGSDSIWAGGAPDTVFGENGKDAIYGGGGPDVLEGGNGKDHIYGGGGPDHLFGGNGNDTLDGQGAFDTLTGGDDADLFVFALDEDEHEDHGGETALLVALAETGAEHTGQPLDTITDFTPGIDQIQIISSVELSFESGPAPLSVWVEQDGDDAIVRIDTNGDLSGEHAAEFSIRLLDIDAGSITSGDFVL